MDRTITCEDLRNILYGSIELSKKLGWPSNFPTARNRAFIPSRLETRKT
jgi:hypothetical protein